MKIDLLKDKNNYIYVTHKDNTNIPSWYPITGALQYGVKDTIKYTKTTINPAADLSFIIGWETSNIIDNITLDIDSSSSYSSIHLMYSMDSWGEGFAEAPTKFASVVWSPYTVNRTVWGPPVTDVVVPTPIYLNPIETLFKPIECKCLKITFVGCSDLILNSIAIEKDETIKINRLLLEPFIYEKYISDILKIYKDTDIESYTDHTIKMLDGYEEP